MADGVIGYLTKPCDANEVLACVSSALERSEPGPYAGFGQANDPHRDSRRVRIGVTITSPTKCMFKTVVTTEYSRASGESFGDATSEVATLDFNKVRWIDIEDGDSPNVVIEGSAWMCKQGGCQDIVKIGISAPQQEQARAIESKRHAIDFIKKACPPRPDSLAH